MGRYFLLSQSQAKRKSAAHVVSVNRQKVHAHPGAIIDHGQLPGRPPHTCASVLRQFSHCRVTTPMCYSLTLSVGRTNSSSGNDQSYKNIQHISFFVCLFVCFGGGCTLDILTMANNNENIKIIMILFFCGGPLTEVFTLH